MRYFIASRWANMKQVQLLTENLTALGHTVFSFVSDPRNFIAKDEIGPSPFSKLTGEWRDNPELKAAYEHDLEGLRESDVVILLLPAGRTSHLQAGIGFGLDKKMVMIGEPEAPETHYLMFDESYPTIEKFIATLKQ